MKKNLLMSSILMMAVMAHAQSKEGTAIYQRTVQLHLEIRDNDEMHPEMPKSLTTNYELSFGNNQSLWKQLDDESAVADNDNGGGVHIRFNAQGQNDISFCDFSLGRKVEQKEIFDKKYIVTDSIKKLNWKLTGETRTILNHVCQKAIAQRIGTRMEMNIENGKMDKKEVPDTANIIAWFTTDIPVAAGPEFPGQLPGLILRLEMKDGSIVYNATRISEKVDLSDIKEPTKGKKVTPDEFKAEQDRLMNEMQKNNEGRGERRIIIRG